MSWGRVLYCGYTNNVRVIVSAHRRILGMASVVCV